MDGKGSLTISAVMATHGRGDRLERVLTTLLDQGGLDEVLVVLDGTEDASQAVAAELASRDAWLRPLWVTHRGQFGALDAGIRAARTDVVWILDDDIVPAAGSAEGHLAHHVGTDGLVVLGHMPVRSPLARRDVVSRIYAREYEARCRRYEAEPDSVLEHLWGGNVSFRRADYLRLPPSRLRAPAGLDDARLYHEDRDLGLRFRGAGLRGTFDRSLHAVHDHRRDPAGFLRDAFGRGVCDVVLHRLHPDHVPAPPPAGRAVHGLGRSLVGRPARRARFTTALGRTVDAAAARSPAAGDRAARATRRLAYAAGAAAATAAAASSAGASAAQGPTPRAGGTSHGGAPRGGRR